MILAESSSNVMSCASLGTVVIADFEAMRMTLFCERKHTKYLDNSKEGHKKNERSSPFELRGSQDRLAEFTVGATMEMLPESDSNV